MVKKSPDPDAPAAGEAPIRADKWLWAARFFKTRALAADAVKGGRVHVNERRAKASTGLKAGDRLTVTKGEVVFEIVIDALSDKRGPAAQAQRLYTETLPSREQRQRRAAERREAALAIPRPMGRPDKKQRRQLRRFKQDSH
jgi:ribosome-associated heat shock protein Hsp15